MEIIGLLGHAGTGKNYVAENILPKILKPKNTVVIAFADHFKVDAIIKYGADYNKVYGQKDFLTRKLLQKVGTEEGRNVYGENIWINAVDTWIKVLNSRGVERFIISDCRFKNEVDWIRSKKNGKVIKINAPNRFKDRLIKETDNNTDQINKIKSHPSELQIDECSYDFVIDNDYGQDPLDVIKQNLVLNN
jgi:dephospho-CoA kinase